MPLAWVSRRRRLLIFLAICIAIGGSIYWCWTPLKRRATWLYYSRQAAAHVMPTIAIAHYSPQSYQNLLSVDSRLDMIGGKSTSVIFLGTLKRPDGTPRLVIITGGRGTSQKLLVGTRVLVLPIPKLLETPPAPPPTGPPPLSVGTVTIGVPPIRTRMQTGVIDPDDRSHIAIEFAVEPPYISEQQIAMALNATTQPGGVPIAVQPATNPAPAGGMIDAYLRNDDSIAFTLRSSFGLTGAGFHQRSIIPGDEKSVRAETDKLTGRGSLPATSRGRVRIPNSVPSTH